MRDPYERVIHFNQSRDERFLAIKYKLMASSAFRFFRGSCHLYYEDLASQQTWKDQTITWICGDLHVENFGSYRSRHQVVYFDLNDFDEAILAHPTWDVSRFICSIFLAGKELNIGDDDLKTIAAQLVDEYLNALRIGKAYAVEKETVDGILKKYIATVSERDPVAFIEARCSLDKTSDRRYLVIDQKKYFKIESKSLYTALIKTFSEDLDKLNTKNQSNFQVLDVAVRIAGTGSIGLNRYVFLVYNSENKTYTLFDMKQAQASSLSLSPFLKIEQPEWDDQAQRIQFIQTVMQYQTPAQLSRLDFQGQAYIVKALQPEQDKIDFKQCVDKPKKFTDACYNMARLIAYAQLRSTGRKGSSTADELINFAQQAELWKTQLLKYTYNYAQQVEQDYQSFCKSYAEYRTEQKTVMSKALHKPE
ncbi:DUF2252 domain-containing protein [Acinetobacter guillouiae]|uniref:DUF2252 domain-containing protein n=1 Tax=Acinetobacter guillouiae TaxID=106649 RepID=UPI001250195E|nr:DUF2252 family protein [Acinetobacter guillouiae]